MLRVRSRPFAFTLTEMLVVIGLAIVLLMIALPVVSKVRSRGGEAECISRLKALGTGLLAYSAEHQNRLMPATNNAEGVPWEEQSWIRSLYYRKYVENPDVFICPGYYPYNSKARGLNGLMGTGRSYGMRIWGYPGDYSRRSEARPLTLIQRPSEFFLLADSYWKSLDGQGYLIQPDPADKNQYVHMRHHRRAHFFFADGSVRPVTREEVRVLSESQAAYTNGSRVQFRCWPEEL